MKNKKDNQIFEVRSRIWIWFTTIIVGILVLLYLIFATTSIILIQLGVLSPSTPFTSIPFIFLITLSCLLGIVLTAIVMRIFFKPTQKLSKAFIEIKNGNFNVKINDKTKFGEINKMYENFNSMIDELSTTETLRNDFVVNVSHEFKTPLTAIEGYATLLQDENLSNEKQQLYAEKIIQNTKRLSSLTGNVLLLSKLENQDTITDKKYFMLDEQIRQIIVNLEPHWSNKNIEFDLDLPEVKFYGSEGLSYQMWNNLINNAIKYTNQDGKIKVAIQKREKSILVIIEDNGIGMDENTKNHVFDKFFQADRSHKAEGNGLGLALVKRIVTLFKGKITLRSKLNEGTTFYIYLPLLNF